VKLTAALQILAGARKELPVRSFYLACGFTPLHLQTFLAAHLQLAYPDSHVGIDVGLYGDLAGNIRKIPSGASAVVVVEWSDLDPRLGFRSLGGWNSVNAADILASVSARLATMADQLSQASQGSPLTVVLPSTPIAPISFTPPWMADRLNLGVRRLVAAFAEDVMDPERVRILNSDALARYSGEVFQLTGELDNGFPYSLAYADFLAEKVALSLQGPRPKKGLITDLDNTLWAGIIGEDGPEGVRWTLDGGAQVHGLYQQLLASLAESGILVGVASKNDSAVVEEALSKLSLSVKAEQLFPRHVNWERKSLSVGAILKSWNIGPQDVVFVDDSPIELEEVKRAFPDMTCLLFNGLDTPHSYGLLLQLRTLFGKARLQQEDVLRVASLRSAEKILSEQDAAESEDEFLAGLRSTLTLSVEREFSEGRAHDLVNKTNQFNLNGRRYELGEWIALQSQPGRILVVADYLDKHGSLGKISVVSGVLTGGTFTVDSWVLSCRAFSRRIEFAVTDFLFRHFGLEKIDLAFTPTVRNGPTQDFLRQVCGEIHDGLITIERDRWNDKRLPFFHEIKQAS
jgi:FkbH-like protein